ncbi:CAZyme family AA9 [Agaricus bisporus var. burnettii]|uniref:lytic cellulose monooxygenase (C4-dehydrogenating) n=1 Tax=Agaricus bisporus var. burnettii TaxID=192524 RepID=A0A8H7C144_AGABI|nr:CAZyme family AA9 [Agaricus bisporus var. burnettii]
MRLSTLAVPLLTAAYASAHGYVSQLSIGDTLYQGDRTGQPTDNSVIRDVSSQDPIKGADNPDLNCGNGSPRPAGLNADAKPGDTMSFLWVSADGGNWPHEIGPLITYMASCGDEDCNEFDSTKAKWFKIDQQGQVSDGSNTWVQKETQQRQPAKVTLPNNIAPGNYLVRHEIIALHLGNSMGGAEFYASCSQLKVSGSGTGKPSSDELVSFPGAYRDDDPGIFTPKVFDPGFHYDFPGPKIAAFVAEGGGNSDSGSSSGSDDPSPNPNPTSTSNGPTQTNAPDNESTTKCNLKKSSKSSSNARRSLNVNSRRNSLTDDLVTAGSSLNVKFYPKHISRVMRKTVFGGKH